MIAGQVIIPDGFSLSQNYPNPFNPDTRIKFGLVEPVHVKLEIFDIYGQLVETLVDETRPAGHYEVVWNAGHFASGIYLCRMKAGSFVQMRKLIFQK